MHHSIVKENTRKIGGRIFAAICILTVLLQLLYLLIGKSHRFEYINNYLFFIVNAVIMLTAFTSLLLLFPEKKSKVLITVFIILWIVNLIFLFAIGSRTKSIVSYSDNFRHELIIKQDKRSGKTVVYGKAFMVLFARASEQLPYTAQGNIKTQWLTNDVCAVTYQDTSGLVHQYVDTYGDRGDGIAYYYVKSVLGGNWTFDGSNTGDNTITVDEKGITVSVNGSEETYANSDCIQCGTIALILCKKGLPQWTIALNEDCQLGDNDELNDEGTITLCKVSMNKTAAMTYVYTSVPRRHGSQTD